MHGCHEKNVRREGGLGILDIRLFNVAFLDKWIWQFGTDNSGLWKEILESNYGSWRDLKSQRVKKSYSLLGRDLTEIWNSKVWKTKFENNLK